MPCWTGAQFVSVHGIHCKVFKDKLVWIIFKNLACTSEVTQFVSSFERPVGICCVVKYVVRSDSFKTDHWMTLLNYSVVMQSNMADFIKKKPFLFLQKFSTYLGKKTIIRHSCYKKVQRKAEVILNRLAETHNKFCKNRTVFIIRVVVFVYGIIELR